MAEQPELKVNPDGSIWRLAKDTGHYYRGCPACKSKVTKEQALKLKEEGRFLSEFAGGKIVFTKQGDENKNRTEDTPLYFLREPFQINEKTTSVSAKLTSLIHTKYEKRLQVEALRTLLEIDASVRDKFGSDAFVILKGSSATRLIILDRLKGLKKHAGEESESLRKLEQDFGKWVTPSDWDAQVVVNPKICNKRNVQKAEKVVTTIHAIVEKHMLDMAARLQKTRFASQEEVYIMNQLGGAEVGDRLLGIEQMLQSAIEKSEFEGKMRVGKRRSFWVKPFLDERAPTTGIVPGQRFRLCTPAAVSQLVYTSPPGITYMSKNTSLSIPDIKVAFDLQRLMACAVDDEGTKYKVELLDVSIAIPTFRNFEFAIFSNPDNFEMFKGLAALSIKYQKKEIQRILGEKELLAKKGQEDPKTPKRIERKKMFTQIVCESAISTGYKNPEKFLEDCEEAGYPTGSFKGRWALVKPQDFSPKQRTALLQLPLDVLTFMFDEEKKASAQDIEKILEFQAKLKACDGRASISVATVEAIMEIPNFSIDPEDYADIDVSQEFNHKAIGRELKRAQFAHEEAKRDLKDQRDILRKTEDPRDKKIAELKVETAKRKLEQAAADARRAKVFNDLAALKELKISLFEVLADINSCESSKLVTKFSPIQRK